MPPQILSDHDPFPFGKFCGLQMQDVPASYLDWLHGQSWLKTQWSSVYEYIERNRKAIDKELRDEELI